MRRALPIVLLGLVIGCDPQLPPEISYTLDVAPILEEHCVRCHHQDGVLHAGVGLDDYLNARSTRIRSVCTALTAARVEQYADVLLSDSEPERGPCADWAPLSMPPGATLRLSGTEQEILALWVAQGALP